MSPRGVSDEDRSHWHRRASHLYEDLRRPAIALVRRAYSTAFDDDELDDIYSSAWLGTLRALERRHAELGDDEIRSYLFTAVANQASKELRRRRRKPVAPLEAAGALVDSADSPEDAATARESSRVTRDLLASLPPRRRAVMLLRYGWGLDPSEICGMVEGLSPRAYRREITRGVDELTARIKLVEEGRWCQEREPLLKAYAAGLADKEEALQAEHHLAHCRHCHEFVGKLSGHLHDLGSAVVLAGGAEALSPDASLLERLKGLVDGVRDGMAGAFSRAEAPDAVALATSARGAGAAGAGVAAKLAGLGAAGKAALACLGAGAVTAVCVVSGIGPDLRPGTKAERPVSAPPHADRAKPLPAPNPELVARVERPRPERRPAPLPEPRREEPPREPESVSPAVEPSTPPVQQEFGVAAAAPAPDPAAAPGGAASEADVQQEFGP